MTAYYLPSESKMGVGYQVHELANALVERGHDVTVFSSSRHSDGALYSTETVELRGRVRTLKFAYKLRNIDWTRFDVLHAHAGDYLLWPGRVPHVRTVHGSSLREIFHIHGFRSRLVMAYFAACEFVATVIADQSVAVSRNTQRWAPWIATIIPNGVDLRRFKPGEKSNHPTILFVGTYRRRKRGKLLADAFEHIVLPEVPDAELWMVCDDAPPRRGLKVLGRVSAERLPQLYRRAWIFCLPSTYEGFGIPYIEAMAAGCPVVATPNAGAVEVTQGGRFGILTQDDELGSALVRLLQAAEEREQIATEAAVHVRKYDLATISARYERIYRTLIDEH
jgi:phosphatidyl-myo-inositol alpha-mannosyltransferase